ncbi:MAG: hypothetical protein KTR31_26040 [Myxococcales bacterium]|nr:hypothetical protein [Myxococcales bacterium]
MTLLPSSAWADDDGCSVRYTLDHLLADLVTVEASLRADDGVRASERAEALHGGLLCLDQVIPRVIVGRTYRAIGGGYTAGGDSGRGVAWLRSAHEVEPTFEYGLEDLPPVHPIRSVYEEVKRELSDRPVTAPGDRSFQVPAFLDGRRLDAPTALPGRPHLLQLDVEPVRSWTIGGADFPDEAFEIDGLPTEPIVVEAEVESDDAVVDAQPVVSEGETGGRPRRRSAANSVDPDEITLKASRKTPWEKTPLIIGGVAMGLAAGGTYAAAWERRRLYNELDGPGSSERVTQLRPVINRLVVVSWALAAAGAGTLTWGVILDGSARPMPGLRVEL